MSRATRRAISWGGTLAVIGAAAVGLRYLPGSGGPVDELRWLLGRSPRRPAALNQAFRIVYEKNKQVPGAGAELMRVLLRDERPPLVEGALLVLARTWGYDPLSDNTNCAVFREWFHRVSFDQKLAHAGAALACCCQALVERQEPASGPIRPQRIDALLAPAATARLAPGGEDVELSLTPEMQRWLVAGTLQRALGQRVLAEILTFRGWNARCELAQRLDFLDDALASKQTDQTRKLIPADAVAEQVRIDFDRLLLMLNDPVDQVRWGAGRILAVAGDARGLSAFCDWLQHNARMSANADKLMTSLFGPNWRDLCARGSSTRQSSPGDGGR